MPDSLAPGPTTTATSAAGAATEAALRRLAGAGVVGILLADFAGRVLDANAEFLQLVGYTRDDLDAGRLRWDQLTPPEWRGIDEQIMRALEATGVAKPVEKEYVHKDGHRVPVLVGGALLSRDTTETVAFVVDLAAQRGAEAAQRVAEARARLAVQAADLGTFDWDVDAGTLAWDARCKAVFGLPAGADVTYERFLTLLHPNDRPRVEQVVARVLDPAGSGEFRVEYRVVWPEGSAAPGAVRWVDARGHAYFAGDGGDRRPTRFLGTVLDATERVAARAALLASEARFHRLVAGIVDYAIFALDPDARVATWNAGAARIKGYAEHEIVGRPYATFFTPEDRAAGLPAALLARAAREGRAEDEGWRLRRDGTRFWASAVITALRDDAGAPAGYSKVTRDLTERRAAEQALARSEERARLALDASGLGTFAWDVERDAHDWDARTRAIYGLAPGEPVTGARLDALIHPEDRGAARAAFAALVAGPGAPRGDTGPGTGPARLATAYRVVRPDGVTRWVEVRGALHVDAADATGVGARPVRLVGTVLDVTERRRAEEDRQFLLDLVARLALLADPAEIGRAAARALGERMGLSRCFFCDVDLGRAGHAEGVYVIRGMEYDAGGPDGVPSPSSLGEWPVGVFGAHVGADARAGRPTVVDDTAADPRTAPSYAAVYGPQEVGAYVHLPLRRAGRWVAALLLDHPGPRAWAEAEVAVAREVAERAWTAVETARLAAAEHAARAEAEAATLLLQEQAAELEAANEALQATAAELEERTQAAEAAHVQAQSAYAEAERERADAERHRAEAERANRARADFLATMSHELRTPLNAIQGYVGLLDEGLYGPLADAQRGALARIGRAQAHLLALVTDVLNFTRLEEGRLAFDVRAVVAADVVRDVVPLVEPHLRAKGLALDVVLPDDRGDAPVLVWADREKLGQVLLNLLANAVKFTPALRADGTPGRVTVALTRRAEAPAAAGAAPADPTVAGATMADATMADATVAYLRVHDTGIGIPRDKQDAVFEPFVQVSTGLTRTSEGTGLGLAISRDLARGMGGDLTAESAPGVGSTFTLTLRAAALDKA